MLASRRVRFRSLVRCSQSRRWHHGGRHGECRRRCVRSHEVLRGDPGEAKLGKMLMGGQGGQDADLAERVRDGAGDISRIITRDG